VINIITFLGSLVFVLTVSYSVNKNVSSIRTPMLMQWIFERIETNVRHFKREVT